MTDFNTDTICLAVSDVHLGASGSRHTEFELFLKEILNEIDRENLKNLKALFLIGDFFDLIMDSFHDITDDYEDIYRSLDRLINRGIYVVFFLGNHEISVVLNEFSSGDHVSKEMVRRRKLKFLRRLKEAFKENNLKFKFLNEKYFCQYAILGKNAQKIWELSLFESEEQIKHNEALNYKELLPFTGDQSEYQCLLAHGYQFFEEELDIAGKIWYLCLKFPDMIKEVVNFLWNEVFKEMSKNIQDFDIKDAINQWKNVIERNYKISLNYFNKYLVKELILLIEKSENFRKSIYDKYDVLVDYIKRKIVSASGVITNVVFGHTHKAVNFNYDGLEIANTGSWHHTKNPTFIQILANGDMILGKYSHPKVEIIKREEIAAP